MKNTLTVLVLFILITIAPYRMASEQSEEDMIRTELDMVFAALADGTIDFFNDHYVPEVTRFHMGGVPLDVGWDAAKASATGRLFDDGWRIATKSYDLTDLRIYGDFAVTAGVAIASESTVNGEAVNSDFRFTYVWIKQDGRWKELHHHVSFYAKPSLDETP